MTVTQASTTTTQTAEILATFHLSAYTLTPPTNLHNTEINILNTLLPLCQNPVQKQSIDGYPLLLA